MSSHSYGYDINHIIALSNEAGHNHIESFAMQLDSFLYNSSEVSSETAMLTEMVVNLLSELVEEGHALAVQNREYYYEQGHQDGYQEAMHDHGY